MYLFLLVLFCLLVLVRLCLLLFFYLLALVCLCLLVFFYPLIYLCLLMLVHSGLLRLVLHHLLVLEYFCFLELICLLFLVHHSLLVLIYLSLLVLVLVFFYGISVSPFANMFRTVSTNASLSSSASTSWYTSMGVFSFASTGLSLSDGGVSTLLFPSTLFHILQSTFHIPRLLSLFIYSLSSSLIIKIIIQIKSEFY